MNRMVKIWSDELDRLRLVEATARELVTSGMKLTQRDGPALIVQEKADKTDPHYRLCKLLDRHE